ncbi:hypothetical protein DPEC_G00261540 [Dallia pectoralis]|uniref:Uncharacterized protein n=1 Tax=Dallia pectoralis TaxID=75939 RepID=A0ACC2FRL4_DALPE|nr:hypothetical protein DPEC_G00261540 [Dallia pectoralis]
MNRSSLPFFPSASSPPPRWPVCPACPEPSCICLTVGPSSSWCVEWWWLARWGWSSCPLPPPLPPLISALQFTPDHQRLHFTQEFSIFYFLSPWSHPPPAALIQVMSYPNSRAGDIQTRL